MTWQWSRGFCTQVVHLGMFYQIEKPCESYVIHYIWLVCLINMLWYLVCLLRYDTWCIVCLSCFLCLFSGKDSGASGSFADQVKNVREAKTKQKRNNYKRPNWCLWPLNVGTQQRSLLAYLTALGQYQEVFTNFPYVVYFSVLYLSPLCKNICKSLFLRTCLKRYKLGLFWCEMPQGKQVAKHVCFDVLCKSISLFLHFSYFHLRLSWMQ